MKKELFSQKTLSRQKIEWIIPSLTVMASIFIFVLMAVFISVYYSPDISLILKKVREISIIVSRFAPEPKERLLYLTGLIFFPFSIILLLLTFRKYIDKLNWSWIHYSYIGTLTFGVTGIALLIAYGLMQPYSLNLSNYDFYFNSSILYMSPLIYSFLVFPLVVCWTYFSPKGRNGGQTVYFTVTNAVLTALSVIFILLIFFLNVYGVGSITNSVIYAFHLNSFLYPVVQVYMGKTLLVNLNSFYGLYPHFLLVIFKLIGLNLLIFTVTMAILLSLSFLFLFGSLRRLIQNPVISFLVFTTIYWEYMLGKIITKDLYYQYMPLRFFFPCLLIFITMIYFHRSRIWLYYTMHLFASSAVLWNFDSGLVVFTAWLLSLGYSEFFEKNIREGIKKTLGHIFTGFAFLIAMLLIFVFYAYLRSGRFPDFTQILLYQKLYYIYGYYMLPMSLWHPWNIVVLVYLAGFTYAMVNLLNKTNKTHSVMLFLLSVMGIGLFTYYQGRSHNWNLFSVSYPAVIILGMFVDVLWQNIKLHRRRLPHNFIYFFIILYFLSFPFLSILVNGNKIENLIYSHWVPLFVRGTSETFLNINFIRKNTVPGEKVFLMSGNESIYCMEMKTRATLDTRNFPNIYFKDELEEVAKFLKNNRDYKIFYSLSFNKIPGYYHLQKLIEILARNYEIAGVSESGTFVLLKRKVH